MDPPPELDEILDRTGVEAPAAAGDDDARMLYCGEAREDRFQVLLRFARKRDSKLRCSEDVDEIIGSMREAWEISRSLGPAFTWRAMVYRIENRKRAVDLLSGDEVDEALTLYDKEEKLLAKHFPGMEVETFGA